MIDISREFDEILNEDILDEDILCEMANLVKSKSGLDVEIWSENKGVLRNVAHSVPRVKLAGDYRISASIEPSPRILAKPSGVSMDKAKRDFRKGLEYVGDNYDIFLKHYNDTDDSFDDEDLFNALRERGVYK